MKFTLSWLREHLDTDAPLDEIARSATMIGLEVEEIADPGAALAEFTTGRVISAEAHPDADKLRVCMVDPGAGAAPVQVVCGAPNARAGMTGILALAGTEIPGTGIVLKKSQIRGVESAGMLLSERELGISDEHEGIVELDDGVKPGIPAAEVLGGDPLIELSITPNRSDCLGVYGIARDLAAFGIGTLKPLDAPENPGSFAPPLQWRRDLPKDHQGACPLVVGRHFRNLRNGPSPEWLRKRLLAIGLRPISTLVDITNFVTFDLGRPLHVFDAARLSGDLTMRFAQPGENVAALDGKIYTLEDGMTVIADDTGVQAIGGVIGGEVSGCSDATTEAFLEVALFDPVRTAATGRKLGIESDARFRFERGVDPASALWGAHVATRLILELCGGEASELTIAGEMPKTAREVTLRLPRLANFGGVALEVDAVQGILDRLGFAPRIERDTVHTTAPSWRPDVESEHCLVEEVLRMHGFDNIPVTPVPRPTSLPEAAISRAQRRAAFARRVLAGRGMLEAVTWSFMPSDFADLFGGVPEQLMLANPISTDLDAMRPSVLPNLLTAAKRNSDRGHPDCRLFEVGPCYRDNTPDGQDIVAAGVRHGRNSARHWRYAIRDVDVFDVKADVAAVLQAAGAPVANMQITADAPAWYHPGRSGSFRLGKTVLAYFGDLHPRVLLALDDDRPASGFEIFLDRVPESRSKGSKARPSLNASPFQPIHRDFAFVVDNTVAANDLLQAARNAEKALISDAGIFDIYEDAALGENKKSIAFWITLQPEDRTPTEAEIDAVAGKIVAAVEKKTGGMLRQ